MTDVEIDQEAASQAARQQVDNMIQAGLLEPASKVAHDIMADSGLAKALEAIDQGAHAQERAMNAALEVQSSFAAGRTVSPPKPKRHMRRVEWLCLTCGYTYRTSVQVGESKNTLRLTFGKEVSCPACASKVLAIERL